MSTDYHCCLDVMGFLVNEQFPEGYHGLFRDEGGDDIPPHEARAMLLDELSRGHKVIPFGKCDNFDWAKGCQGHPVLESAADLSVQSSREMTKENT